MERLALTWLIVSFVFISRSSIAAGMQAEPTATYTGKAQNTDRRIEESTRGPRPRAKPLKALTVAAAIQTRRLLEAPTLTQFSSDGEYLPRRPRREPVVVSPDGRRFSAILISGDLQHNGNWAEVIAGRLDSLEAASHYETIARLFTNSEGEGASDLATSPVRLTFGFDNPLTWIDGSSRVAFRWVDQRNIIQVVAMDVATHRMEFLMAHPTHVMEWASDGHGGILYTALVKDSETVSAELRRRGFVVENQDLYSVLAGRVNGHDTYESTRNEVWLVRTPGEEARRISFGGTELNRSGLPLNIQIAPDGRRAIVTVSAPDIPSDWDAYTAPALKAHVHQVRQQPGRHWHRAIRQHFIVNLLDGTTHALWNAPAQGVHQKVVWAPDSQSVLIAPTFLPTDSGATAGLDGSAVATVDADSGRYQQVPVPAEVVKEIRYSSLLEWESSGVVTISNDKTSVAFRKRMGQWESRKPSTVARRSPRMATRRVRVELRQSMNTPPALYAVDVTNGRQRMILDLNPQLRTEFALGHVEAVQWCDESGKVWHGRLYYPVGYKRGVRYPLVISTHGVAPPNEFSLYGRGFPLGPSFGIHAAQPLANRGIAVLQMEDKRDPDTYLTPREAPSYVSAFEAAVDKWVGAGLVNRAKVGLTGFSRAGWLVEYALVHSQVRYAAAIAADNMDASYVQRVNAGRQTSSSDMLNGARPFGDGLTKWLERAPGFNADKVRTPLQLQSHMLGLPSVAGLWEMFSRLRQLGKPVELYVIPDVEHGSHGIQNPRQSLGALEHAVDWLDFWLNEHEDLDPQKAEQYSRWRELRARVQKESAPTVDR